MAGLKTAQGQGMGQCWASWPMLPKAGLETMIRYQMHFYKSEVDRLLLAIQQACCPKTSMGPLADFHVLVVQTRGHSYISFIN